jgi:iron complex outermembrane receptor protein
VARLRATLEIAALTCLLPAGACACDIAGRQLTQQIPSLPIEQAIKKFRTQTGLLSWATNEQADKLIRNGKLTTRQVAAGTSPADALRSMLQGTGLDFQCTSKGRHVTIIPSRSPMPAVAQPEVADPDVLQEVVITPEGFLRPPIAADVSEMDSQRIEDSNIKVFDQAAQLVPAVNFGPIASVGGLPYTILVIRGGADRHSNVAGMWLDDIPLPAATSNSFARGYPYMFDLESFDVKRGPQPVLLGANAQSGAVQFSFMQPSTKDYAGKITAGWSVTDGGAPTRELGAALGGPMPGTYNVGIRAAAWYRSEGGFVDRVNPFTREVVAANADRNTSKGLRVAVRNGPEDGSYLMPAFLYQSTVFADSGAFNIYESPSHPDDSLSVPRLGRFLNGSLVAQPFRDQLRLGSLRGLKKFGDVDQYQVQTVTAYIERWARMLSDDTESMRWGGFGNPDYPGEDAYPARQSDLITTQVGLRQHAFSQQVQLKYERESLSWGIGAFFSDIRTHETDHVHADKLPNQPLKLGPLAGQRFDLVVPTSTVQKEAAGFAWAKYWMSERFAVSAGARLAHQISRADSTDDPDPEPILSGPLPQQFAEKWTMANHSAGSDTVVAPESGLVYQVGGTRTRPNWEYTFTAARGYAPGNVDAARPTCLEDPVAYGTDTLWSYELGVRHLWHESKAWPAKFSFNLFETRWDNGPIAQRTCLFMHLPGKARSRGFDGSIEAPLGNRFTASLDVAYVDARYTETHMRNDGDTVLRDTNEIPQVPGQDLVVRAGDALGTPPQVVSPWSITASVQWTISLHDQKLRLRFEDSYHSRNHGPFYNNDPQAIYGAPLRADPATNLLNFKTTLEHRKFDIALAIGNLLNARPVLLKRNKGNDVNTLFYATTLRPRTINLSLTWKIQEDAGGN